jgi:predicted extracellular nuclease
LTGDANGDGVRHFGDDEFVEIVNNSGTDTDISGWTVSDGFSVRHSFPSGTIVPDSCSVVVFGGGTPTGTFGNSLVQTASGGSLGLNNGGDTVTLTLNDGVTDQASYAYGGEGGDNQSLTRDPDITGATPLVKHSTAAGSGGALFSPGTMIDGSQFAGCPLVVTLIHDVQGAGSASPLVGQTVAIEGIVVGDFQDDVGANGDLNGFFVQEEDADADGNALTSEGVFVFQGSNPTVDVAIGDHVRVEGSVSEFFGNTQITSFSGVTVNSSGNPLPAASVLSLPVTAISDFEAYEGMYVTFPQALVISEFFNFDRFGEIVLTTDRQFQPTAVFEPGSVDSANLADLNTRSRITLDDGRTSQNPDPAIHPNGLEFDLTNLFRGGDTVSDVTGVINYSFDLYRVQPTQGANYTSVNARPASPDPVGGNVTVAAFNVLNYFTTLDYSSGHPLDNTCGPLENQGCRGADANQPDEFTRQRDKIIAAISAIDADVVGLIEIENHPTDVPLADLVSGLNDVMGAGTYEYVATGPVGPDVIRVAFIYKPASVSLFGDFAVLDTPAFLDPNNLGSNKNRAALAQTFSVNSTGGVFTAVVNHLKSKGSSCGAGDDHPEAASCNLTRTLAAQELLNWLATDPTNSNDEDFMIIGDLNAYDKEDPIDVLVAGGYTDLAYYFEGEYAYSYVFNGQLGYLDFALTNAELLDEVTGVTEWHINADEADMIDYDTSFKGPNQDAIYFPDAYRASDHDPVIVGMELTTEAEIIELMDQVQTLVDEGWLNGGQGNSYLSKLENVLSKLASGKTKAAANQLGAFINEVQSYVDEGILTADQGDALINAAAVLVGALDN